MIELDIRKFYLIGAILFVIIILGNIYSLLFTWELINIGAKVASTANILFNFLLLWLFLHFYRETPSINKNDFDDLIEELKEGSKNDGATPRNRR